MPHHSYAGFEELEGKPNPSNLRGFHNPILSRESPFSKWLTRHAIDLQGRAHPIHAAMIGLGESGPDLMTLFEDLLERQIFSYFFCFNPEPDFNMADHLKTPVDISLAP